MDGGDVAFDAPAYDTADVIQQNADGASRKKDRLGKLREHSASTLKRLKKAVSSSRAMLAKSLLCRLDLL